MSTKRPPGSGMRHLDAVQDCVHCGLCLTACPTYLELGTEADSPRGRIHLMRRLGEGELDLDRDVARHLDLCLGCRACESACPSGVRYGEILEDARALVRAAGLRSRRTRWIHAALAAVFTRPAVLAALLAPIRWLDRRGLLASLRRRSRWLRLLPPLDPPRSLAGREFRTEADLRSHAFLFEGCVAQVMFSDLHAATVRVLLRNGCDVSVPREQACCGALLAHAGAREEARALARRNVDGFGRGTEPIIANVAGCGAMLREYGALLADDPRYAARAAAFAARVRDISEHLDHIGLAAHPGSYPARVAYHDACHLAHAQGLRDEPRRLLRHVPDLELLEIDESEVCCGAAGSYNLTEPEMADRLGARKARAIAATRADVAVAANAGCAMHIRAALDAAGTPTDVLHPVEILDRAYGSSS